MFLHGVDIWPVVFGSLIQPLCCLYRGFLICDVRCVVLVEGVKNVVIDTGITEVHNK